MRSCISGSRDGRSRDLGITLLAIIKAFKTWWHYLKDCKLKVLIFINYNNFYRLMDTKSLSFCHI